MADSKSLELSLTCPICLDIASADNAVETSCCHQLFCSPCIENVQPCPACRQKDFTTAPAHFARRLIGNLPTACSNEGCNAKINRSDLSKHVSLHCPFRMMKCPDPNCADFQCPKQSILKHLLDKHEKVLIDNFEKLWQNEVVTKRVVVVNEPPPEPVRVMAPAASAVIDNDDRIGTATNRAGRRARLGSTGKYYCDGRLDGTRCSCCNGRCGPSNGCNCSACMQLDVQKRKLPRGWLVNRDGASARCTSVTPGKFYCGRMVMQDDRRTDGYCGPTNGEQCLACRRLNEQQSQRYQCVWES